MDETEADDVVTVGQRLKEAREAKGLSVEDVASQTRIPTRHLTSLEQSEWDKLPAATVGSSRVDLQACKLEYSIVSPK